MNAQQAIAFNIDMAMMIATSYLEDMSEEELMHRPHPKSNHIKWQLGHLIASDNQMINGCCPGAIPELPEGFAQQYGKETAGSDDPTQFHSKAEFLEMHRAQTAAIKAALGEMTASDLDQPSPEAMREYAPTVGSAFVMIGSHWIMHTGQWAVVRRQLGRDPLF